MSVIETKGAAEAAPAIAPAITARGVRPVAGQDFLIALGAAIAQAEPGIAASVEASLAEGLSQARTRKDHERAAEVSRTLEWFRDLVGAGTLAPRPPSATAPDSDAPPLSPELILWRNTTAALVATLGPKKARHFLRTLAARFGEEENITHLFPMRPSPVRKAMAAARQQACAYFRACLAELISSLPSEA